MDHRIFRWPRFVTLFDDFREMFADHLNRVKNKSSLDHFEYKNNIQEWEWRVILSMCGTLDLVPPPFSSESLDVYLLMFSDHDEITELFKIRDKQTPLYEMNQWVTTVATVATMNVSCLTGREIQEMNAAFELRHLEMKRRVRAWLKRWNVRSTPWTSRNRSAVCKIMSTMIQLPPPGRRRGSSKLGSGDSVEDWIDSHIPGKPEPHDG